MIRFIKKSLFLALIFPLFILFFTEFLEYIVNKESVFKLHSEVKYLVLGHSHPECAYNDSLIADFQNISFSGESYFYSYFKLKKVLEQNTSIKVVFIEFTNNQINSSMNKWIWDEYYMNSRYSALSSFMEFEDKWLLLRKNPSGFLNSISLSLKYNLKHIAKRDFNFDVGGYRYLNKELSDSVIKSDNVNEKAFTNSSISDYNLLYLDKIIRYCSENEKIVILVRSPQHAMYQGYSNEVLYQQIRKKKYDTIMYLDLGEFPLSNSDFVDLEHLNSKGAIKVSNWISEGLNSGLLDSLKHKSKIIEDERLSKNDL